ncbi:Structure-specific endonuclease subunit slx1, partial [Linum grandiflorum]
NEQVRYNVQITAPDGKLSTEIRELAREDVNAAANEHIPVRQASESQTLKITIFDIYKAAAGTNNFIGSKTQLEIEIIIMVRLPHRFYQPPNQNLRRGHHKFPPSVSFFPLSFPLSFVVFNLKLKSRSGSRSITGESVGMGMGEMLIAVNWLKEHNGELKGGAKASRSGRPWVCACLIKGFCDRSEACKFETKWKGLSRKLSRKRASNEAVVNEKTLELLQHRKMALDRVKDSLDCRALDIVWHLL